MGLLACTAVKVASALRILLNLVTPSQDRVSVSQAGMVSKDLQKFFLNTSHQFIYRVKQEKYNITHSKYHSLFFNFQHEIYSHAKSWQ